MLKPIDQELNFLSMVSPSEQSEARFGVSNPVLISLRLLTVMNKTTPQVKETENNFSP
jgi:hypothetical protein